MVVRHYKRETTNKGFIRDNEPPSPDCDYSRSICAALHTQLPRVAITWAVSACVVTMKKAATQSNEMARVVIVGLRRLPHATKAHALLLHPGHPRFHEREALFYRADFLSDEARKL